MIVVPTLDLAPLISNGLRRVTPSNPRSRVSPVTKRVLSRIHAFQPLTRQDDKLQVTCFQVVVDQNPTALQLGFSYRLVSVPGLSRCIGKRARQRPIQASLCNPTAWIRLSRCKP